MKKLAIEQRTMIFYEFSKRILKLLDEIKLIIGDRYGVLSRKMTKLHEEFLRGSISEILQNLKAKSAVKGEITLLVKGYIKDNDVPLEIVNQEVSLLPQSGRHQEEAPLKGA